MWNVAWLSNGEDTTPEREANLATDLLAMAMRLERMLLLQTLIQLCLVPVVVATSAFRLNGNPECDNDLTFTNVQVTCGSAEQGTQYGYNNNRGYGDGYRYNNGYNNGGQYYSNYNNYNNNNNEPEGEGEREGEEGPEEEGYMYNGNVRQSMTWSAQGNANCYPGDTVYVKGTISIPQTGLYGYDMENKVCLYGRNWGWLTCKEIDVSGASFCSMFGLMAYGCPETGEFDVTTSFTLPAAGEGFDLGSSVYGFYSLVYTKLTTNDGFTYSCKTRIDTVSPNYTPRSNSTSTSSASATNTWTEWKSKASSKWSDWHNGSSNTGSSSSSSADMFSSTYAMVSLSIVAVGGLVTALIVRKRKLRAGRINLNREEEQESSGNFEVMGDGLVRV